jgi:hypothetical protein
MCFQSSDHLFFLFHGRTKPKRIHIRTTRMPLHQYRPADLMVPQLWLGLIVGALFLPSPEIVEASSFGEFLEGAKTAVSTAEIPGLNNGGLSLQQLANPKLDPNLFVPVCKFSDGFYRTAKNAVYSLAGQETYQVPMLRAWLLPC